MPFSSPFELHSPHKQRELSDTPHLEPRGFVVAVTGVEIVAQLLTNTHARATANALNVRDGAGTNFKINKFLKKNTVHTIIEEKDGWGKLKNGSGWIKLSYTQKVEYDE